MSDESVYCFRCEAYHPKTQPCFGQQPLAAPEPTPTPSQEWKPEVGDWFILKASYCGPDTGCDDSNPCADCLAMSNRYVIGGEHCGKLWLFGAQLCNRTDGNRLNDTMAYVLLKEPDECFPDAALVSDCVPIPNPSLALAEQRLSEVSHLHGSAIMAQTRAVERMELAEQRLAKSEGNLGRLTGWIDANLIFDKPEEREELLQAGWEWIDKMREWANEETKQAEAERDALRAERDEALKKLDGMRKIAKALHDYTEGKALEKIY